MSEHRANIEWRRTSADFSPETYSRAHVLRFDGGIEVAGNAAPDNIPATAPHAPGIDPEQAFVAALSSCHMLWFLFLACREKWVVDSYSDEAAGVLGKDTDGRMAMTRVTLRPMVAFSGLVPAREQLMLLHEKAHQRCFIANSVKTEVLIEPR